MYIRAMLASRLPLRKYLAAARPVLTADHSTREILVLAIPMYILFSILPPPLNNLFEPSCSLLILRFVFADQYGLSKQGGSRDFHPRYNRGSEGCRLRGSDRALFMKATAIVSVRIHWLHHYPLIALGRLSQTEGPASSNGRWSIGQ